MCIHMNVCIYIVAILQLLELARSFYWITSSIYSIHLCLI